MVDILLTNDDGYSSRGFYPLLKKLSNNFLVVAVAPLSEQSWIGKSISIAREVSLSNIKLNEFDISALNGTPADCVQIGLYDVIKGKPRLVVSGINLGLNTGHGRILSSGTIGASMEAFIDGVKSVSSSIHIPENIEIKDIDESVFKNAAEITEKIVKILIDKTIGDSIDLVSINIPLGATINTDIEITRPHRDPYGKLFYADGDKFKHRTPPINFRDAKPGTDLRTLADGKISITPIDLELASDKSMKIMNRILKEGW